MFVVDPPGPVPGQLTLERLRLPNARERVTLNFSDEPGDPTSHLAVRRQPEQEVLPGVRIEVDLKYLEFDFSEDLFITFSRTGTPGL